MLVYMRTNNPKTDIVLLAILPRGGQTDQTWWDWPNRFSRAIDSINGQLEEFARSLDGVHYVDCSAPFLPDGRVGSSTNSSPIVKWTCEPILNRIQAVLDPMMHHQAIVHSCSSYTFFLADVSMILNKDWPPGGGGGVCDVFLNSSCLRGLETTVSQVAEVGTLGRQTLSFPGYMGSSQCMAGGQGLVKGRTCISWLSV